MPDRELDETWISTGSGSGNRDAETERRADLVIIAHPDPRFLGRRYEVRPDSDLVLGRSSEADISLPDVKGLSRRQAHVRWVGDDVVVHDLDSTNGTFVNRTKVEESTILRSEDLVEVERVAFKFFRGTDVEHSYHEAIYDLVMRDELTGAYNRRMYERSIERDFFRARRHGRPLSLLLFDLDELREINDTQGHLAGDRVLNELVTLIGPILRREEVLARIGGDEFVVICPEVVATGATILAQRIRDLVAGHPFSIEDRSISLTCSFGVADLRPEMESPKDLFVAADRLLKSSKTMGGNQIRSVVDRQGKPT